MRYFFLFLLLTSFTALPTDRELLNGTWSFYELKGQDGKVMFTSDKAKQKELIDEAIQEQLEHYADGNIDEQMLRDMISKQFEKMEKMTFTFDKKGVARVETNGEDKTQDTESPFTMNEEKKQIAIKSGDEEMTYVYTFDGKDKITLKGETEVFILVRTN